MYEEYLDIIDQKADKLFKLSDNIWECAELAFTEYKSASYLIQALEEEGFFVEKNLADIDTAFSGKYGSGKPVIGILGEFDALSGLSQEADVAEKKAVVEGGCGHGCGHNLLGSGSLAAAIAVKNYLEKTGKSGTVIYYGCPGEEGGSGKAFMARRGIFSKLDLAITWHPAEYNRVNEDSTLANIQVLYRFYGISAHAAGCPELGRSALDAVELMNVGANFLREHMVQEARIHYAILNTGGTSPNVVQNYAEVLYLIRAPKSSQVQELFKRVNKIAEGMAMATETRMEYEIYKLCSNYISNKTIERQLYAGMQDVKLPEYSDEELAYARKFTASANMQERTILRKLSSRIISQEKVDYVVEHINDDMYNFNIPYERDHIVSFGLGSTDVGDVSFMCPTSQVDICTWAPCSGGHSWQIVAQGKSSIAHKGMLYAGKVMAHAAISMIENPELIEEAKKEFDNRMKEEKYVPIPEGVNPRPMGKVNK